MRIPQQVRPTKFIWDRRAYKFVILKTHRRKWETTRILKHSWLGYFVSLCICWTNHWSIGSWWIPSWGKETASASVFVIRPRTEGCRNYVFPMIDWLITRGYLRVAVEVEHDWSQNDKTVDGFAVPAFDSSLSPRFTKCVFWSPGWMVGHTVRGSSRTQDGAYATLLQVLMHFRVECKLDTARGKGDHDSRPASARDQWDNSYSFPWFIN